MSSLDVQTLPVVDEAARFVGVVDRSKLTASMLIDIAAKVGR
jgi:CBS-domain-containing membrane protein